MQACTALKKTIYGKRRLTYSILAPAHRYSGAAEEHMRPSALAHQTLFYQFKTKILHLHFYGILKLSYLGH